MFEEKDKWSVTITKKKIVNFLKRSIIAIFVGLIIIGVVLVGIGAVIWFADATTTDRNECDFIETVVVTDLKITESWNSYGRVDHHIKFKCNSSIVTNWIDVEDLDYSVSKNFPVIHNGTILKFYWTTNEDGSKLRFVDVISD